MALKTRLDHGWIKDLIAAEWGDEAIAAYQECSASYVRLIRIGRITLRVPGDPVKLSRLTAIAHELPHRPYVLARDHPAVTEARTLFPSKVMDVDQSILKSGYNSSKIGKRVMKGAWKGFPIFTLSLEERATCPSSCSHWRDCYGSHMPHAKRYRHGPELEAELEIEITKLRRRFPWGFVIRLHVLGDFYSIEYVRFWERMMMQHRALHVFGYTARWQTHDKIGFETLRVIRRWPDRFCIRFSDAPKTFQPWLATVSIKKASQAKRGTVVCPAQTGQTSCCSTCALCWSTERKIAFINH